MGTHQDRVRFPHRDSISQLNIAKIEFISNRNFSRRLRELYMLYLVYMMI